MKEDPTLNERWLHERLQDDPSLLGLGNLEAISSERRQPSGGRLDLLLRDPDPESRVRYEVEIQLGETDESHLVRTIEYWDIERRRYPQYDHIAVIVAEKITGRFLNVISLFNGSIPLIAIQLKGVEVNGAFTLVATTVLDVLSLGTEEEDEGEVFDRASWERQSSSAVLSILDQVTEMIGTVLPGVQPKYNKNYIGLAKPGNSAQNFVTFVPRRQHIIVRFRIAQDDTLSSQLASSRLDVIAYDKRSGRYRVRIDHTVLEDSELRSIIAQLIERAHKEYPTTM